MRLSAVALLFALAAPASAQLGDRQVGAVVDLAFDTTSNGVPTTLGGTPAVSVYKANGTTESTAGVTLTADFDGRTGLNQVRITTASDATFYAAGGEFSVVITTGTVDGLSVVGRVVASFSLQAATVASVQGNVTGSVASVTGAVGSVTGNVGGNVVGSVASVAGNVGGNVTGSVGSVAADGITASSIATGAIGAAEIDTDAIGAAELAANAIGSSEVADGAIDAGAIADASIDAATFAAGAIDAAALAAGAITSSEFAQSAGDVVWASGTRSLTDKAGFSLSAAGIDSIWDEPTPHNTASTMGALLTGATAPTAAAVADAVWDEAIAGHLSAGSTGAALSAAGAAGDPWTATLPGSYADGTAGRILGTLDVTAIELVSPVLDGDTLELVAGDAYDLDHARELDNWALTGQPSLTGATVTLVIDNILSVTATSVTGAGGATQTPIFELTAAQTALLVRKGSEVYTYQIQAVWAADNPTQPAVLARGKITVIDRAAP